MADLDSPVWGLVGVIELHVDVAGMRKIGETLSRLDGCLEHVLMPLAHRPLWCFLTLMDLMT